MGNQDSVRLEQGRRLKTARKAAGFRSAAGAVKASPAREKWKKSTYSAHERGTRTIGQDDAERYARFFYGCGAEITAISLLFGPQNHIIEAANAEVSRFLVQLTEEVQKQQLALPLHHVPPRPEQKAPDRAPKELKKPDQRKRP
jgi:hypothetical protein